MGERFEFFMPTRICFENGLAKQVGQYIEGERIFIISDPFLYENGTARAVGDAIVGKEVTYFYGIEPNPSCESVDEAARLAREAKADCVIGLGGGSSLDVSKMVACLITNEGSIYDYYSGGSKSLKKRTTQLICIPTTAGTGSEVTNVGVFTNKKTGIKMPMVHVEFWPDIAIVDGELTVTLPSFVTAATGMDAFCHAIEAYWNKNALPICDMLAMGAIKIILENIKMAYDNPKDTKARGNMITASLIAGMAFSQTRTTGIHALSFPLTTEFGASHGTACSITLSAFIRKSTELEATKMEKLVSYLGYANVLSFAEEVEALMKSMKMPVRLHEIGVEEKDLEHITKVGLSAAIIQLSPAVMNENTVYELLHSIL